MRLHTLQLENYRCYKSIQILDMTRLVIFIGENDAGKTVLLDAVEALIGTRAIRPTDFHRREDGIYETEFTIEGIFNLAQQDDIPEDFCIEDQIVIRRICKLQEALLHEWAVMLRRRAGVRMSV